MSLDARARRAAQAARSNVDRLPPPPAIGVLVARRRRRAAAANALVLALIVAVGGLAWRILPIGDPQPTATGLPRHVQAAIRVGKAPGAVVVAEGSVWVANSGDSTVSRIDPVTNRVTATIGVGGHPTRLTADLGAVWVANPHGLQRIDPATNRVVQTLPLPIGLGDVVLDTDGCLWVSLNDGTVRRLNPFDGRELASVSVASRGVSVLASGSKDRLWALNGDVLVAINPQDAGVTERLVDEKWNGHWDPQVAGLVLVERHMWVADSDGEVSRLPLDPPPKNEIKKEIRGQLVSREGPAAIAAGPTGVFLASRSTQTVTRFDLSTGQARARIRLPEVSDVAVGADAVWTTAGSRGLLYRIVPNATD
jgi:YVTN family beta-propeller protein